MPAPVPPSDEVRQQHTRTLMRLLDRWAETYRDGGPDALADTIGPLLAVIPRDDLAALVFGACSALGAVQRVLLDMSPDLFALVGEVIAREGR